MTDPAPADRRTELIVLAAALGAVAILWLSRDVMPADIALRMVLTVLWLGFWSVAALGAGNLVHRGILRDRDLELEDLPIVLLSGAGVLAFVAACLALIGLLRGWLLMTILLCAIAAGGARLRPVVRTLASRCRSCPPAPLALAMLAGLALVPVLSAPPVMYDTLNYHLAFPSQWLNAGAFVEFPRHGFSYYPSAHGLLYGYALATVGPWGATAIHFWFGGMAAAVAGVLGWRLGGSRTAAWAAACFVLTPAVLEVAAYASADLAVAAWGGAAVAALVPGEHRPRTVAAWAASGWLLGCALAAKYLALAVVLLPWLAAAALLSRRRLSLRDPVAAALVAAIPVLPWLLRNLTWTGNPLYPYLQGMLGGPATSMGIGVEILKAGDTAPGSLVWLLQTIGGLAIRTVEPLRQGGLLGAHWLLLLAVAAVVFATSRSGSERRIAPTVLWVFTVIGLAAWGSLVQLARFLLPVLVVAAPLAGRAADFLTSGPSRPVRWAFSVLLMALFVWNSSMLATRQNIDRLSFAAGQIGGDEYLDRWVSYAPVLEHLNRELPPGSRVLFVAEPRSLYVDPPVVVEDPLHTPLLLEMADAAGSARAVAQRLTDRGITHLLVNPTEMPLSASLRGVDHYWDGLGAEPRAVVEELFRSWVVRTAGSERVWVGRLAPPSASP